MVNKKLIISLVCITALSLFFFITTYNQKITNATITRQQLSVLEVLDVFTNTEDRLTKLLAIGEIKAWLHLAKQHADKDGNTAYQLAEYFRQYGQLTTAQLWYQVAIRQQHVSARVALAEIYFNLQKYADIPPLLIPVANNENALAILYKVALEQGDVAFIAAYKSRLARDENAELYLELTQYDVFRTNLLPIDTEAVIADKTVQQVKSLNEKNITKNSSCLVDVQLFATNLAGLRHGQQLILAFKDQILAKYICLQSVKYIPKSTLNCQHLVAERITCNAAFLASHQDITARYLGIIVERGGANVDNGIMYIDQNDDLDVLVHELSHFIGFVDEYPLPFEHQKCQQPQQMPFAHNIVVLTDYYQGERKKLRENILSQVPWRSLIKDSTPILSKYQQGWKLTTPIAYQEEIGVFRAESCDKKITTQAFKPTAQRTKLQYFELLLPKSYIDIMLLAPNFYLMPSYHFNVSRDLAKQGEYMKAREVLQATLFD